MPRKRVDRGRASLNAGTEQREVKPEARQFVSLQTSSHSLCVAVPILHTLTVVSSIRFGLCPYSSASLIDAIDLRAGQRTKTNATVTKACTKRRWTATGWHLSHQLTHLPSFVKTYNRMKTRDRTPHLHNGRQTHRYRPQRR